MPNCPGCGKSFSQRGYTNHLLQTTQSPCKSIRDNLAIIPDPDDDGLENIDAQPPPLPFEGDFFGDYAPVDFEFENDLTSEIHESSEDSETESDFDLDEQGWEPPIDSCSISGPSTSNNFYDDTARTGCFNPHDSDMSSAQIHHETRWSIEEDVRKKTFVEHFPGGLAGSPILKQLETTEYVKYGEFLDDIDGKKTIWAPFTSKLDWEIARWAKMRGPGSTAVSELLGIEDVRMLFLIYHLTNG